MRCKLTISKARLHEQSNGFNVHPGYKDYNNSIENSCASAQYPRTFSIVSFAPTPQLGRISVENLKTREYSLAVLLGRTRS